MRKHGVFFVQGVRPTGSRGFGCDRCRGQEEGVAKGEETGSVLTDQREGEQTTMFRGGTSQVQILSPQFNKKHHTRKCVVFFCCVKMYHAEAGKLGAKGSFQIPAPQRKWGRWRRLCGAKCLTPAPQREMGTPKAALRSKVLDPLRNSKNIMPSRFPLRKHHFCFSFLKGNCDGWLQKKTSVAF